MRFFDREFIDPSVHCFARCYMCKRLVAIKRDQNDGLDFSGRECPHCGVLLTTQHLANTFLENTLNTQAVTSAKKIAGLDPAAIIVIVVSLLLAVIGFYPVWFRAINVIIYLAPPVIIIQWLYKFWWKFRFSDDEYLDAVRHMKLSLCLWIAAEVLCAVLLLL